MEEAEGAEAGTVDQSIGKATVEIVLDDGMYLRQHFATIDGDDGEKIEVSSSMSGLQFLLEYEGTQARVNVKPAILEAAKALVEHKKVEG